MPFSTIEKPKRAITRRKKKMNIIGAKILIVK
jgi:hypothetical protein